MKQRFSSLDVKVIAHELNQSLTTLRVANIYNLSTQILLFKLAKSDTKKQFLIDIGFRCHTTEFYRVTAGMPSAFVSKLRKLLKTRRLTSVSQIGTDRILELQFSDGQYRLFLEFFASGNVILTDTNLKILSLYRNVAQGKGQEPQKAGLQYSLESRQNFFRIPEISESRVQAALNAAVAGASAKTHPGSKMNSKKENLLRGCLAVCITELPPILVDHTLQANKFDTSLSLETILEAPALLTALTQHLQKARELMDSIISSEICKGFIFAKKSNQDPISEQKNHSTDSKAQRRLLYDDFQPFIPAKFEQDDSIEVIQFEGYNQTVDDFFSSLEGQKLESRLIEREAAAQRKLTAAKQGQESRIKGLQDVQSQNFRKAAAIEANIKRVQEAMDSINGLLDQGMDWVDIGKLVEREKKKNNPVANVICLPLKLAKNIVSLRLSEEDECGNEGESSLETNSSECELEVLDDEQKKKQKNRDNTIIVEVDLTLSPWSNARGYYGQRKTAVVKEAKTHFQAAKAIQSTEQKIKQDLKKALKHEKALLQPLRKSMWFEKFFWFISSDRYLVLGAKDTSQAEILYRRYLRFGDILCHADAKGAAVVVIKNNANASNSPIPPNTLSQAGQLSVCSSEAWDSKASTGAWWVNANQVSKFSTAGDLLQPGNFNISGEKNFFPTVQLVLGVGVLFRVSEESISSTLKHHTQDEDLKNNTTKSGTALDDHFDPLQQSTIRNDNSSNEYSDDIEGGGNVRGDPLQLKNHSLDIASRDKSGSEEESLAQCVSSAHAGKVAQQKFESMSDINTPESAETGFQTIGVSVAELGVSRQTSKIDPNDSKKLKRGQRRKAKKIAVKYRDQDEDDRAAAEAVIGATIGKHKAEAEIQAKLEREKELERDKLRRQTLHEKKQKEIAAHEGKGLTIRNAIDAESDEEIDYRTPINVLVGTPGPGDELLEAVTVCAPWSALSRCKYKVKLQPGAVKKGKAVKELLEQWRAGSVTKGAVDENSLDTEKCRSRELELMKGFRAEEVVNTIPARKVRLIAGFRP